MDPVALDREFLAFGAERGVDLERTPVSVGVSTMLAFFRERRVDGIVDVPDGDMLLFQWGTFDWGDGNHFELDITRQVIPLPEPDGEDVLWQLHLTYRFEPEDALTELGQAHRWCASLDELPAFEAHVLNSTPLAAVAERIPAATVIDYECV